jgi:hypothetical protein
MNNPLAFPGVEYKEPTGGGSHIMTIVNGMSLRDYFAAKAMQSILLDTQHKNESYDIDALFAYAMADAMLEVRSKS